MAFPRGVDSQRLQARRHAGTPQAQCRRHAGTRSTAVPLNGSCAPVQYCDLTQLCTVLVYVYYFASDMLPSLCKLREGWDQPYCCELRRKTQYTQIVVCKQQYIIVAAYMAR